MTVLFFLVWGKNLVRLCTEWLVEIKKALQQQVTGQGLI
jgi:hypothetical protein